MICFSFKIINFWNSPPLLKRLFIKNEERNVGYNLRNKDKFVEHGAKSKSGENTFQFIFPRLANSFVIQRNMLKFATFKLSIFNNINLIYNETIKIFDKFNLRFKYFVF